MGSKKGCPRVESGPLEFSTPTSPKGSPYVANAGSVRPSPGAHHCEDDAFCTPPAGALCACCFCSGTCPATLLEPAPGTSAVAAQASAAAAATAAAASQAIP